MRHRSAAPFLLGIVSTERNIINLNIYSAYFNTRMNSLELTDETPRGGGAATVRRRSGEEAWSNELPAIQLGDTIECVCL